MTSDVINHHEASPAVFDLQWLQNNIHTAVTGCEEPRYHNECNIQNGTQNRGEEQREQQR